MGQHAWFWLMGGVGDEFGRGSQGLMLVIVIHVREAAWPSIEPAVAQTKY